MLKCIVKLRSRPVQPPFLQYFNNFTGLFGVPQTLCKVTLEEAVAFYTFPWLYYVDFILLMPPVTSSSFSLQCCTTAGFEEIIGLCLNPRQLFLCSHSQQYCLSYWWDTYTTLCFSNRTTGFFITVETQFSEKQLVVQKYPWKEQQVLIGAERILSSFQVKATARPLYGWTLQSKTWAGWTLWSWSNIFSGEYSLLLPNWPTSPLGLQITS